MINTGTTCAIAIFEGYSRTPYSRGMDGAANAMDGAIADQNTLSRYRTLLCSACCLKMPGIGPTIIEPKPMSDDGFPTQHLLPRPRMSEDQNTTQGARRIILNAFDMFTPSHLSFGQWRRDDDRSKTKRRDLSYWTDLAKILERGDINALVIADTFGQHDVYKGGAETTLRLSVQYPMGDPAIVSRSS